MSAPISINRNELEILLSRKVMRHKAAYIFAIFVVLAITAAIVAGVMYFMSFEKSLPSGGEATMWISFFCIPIFGYLAARYKKGKDMDLIVGQSKDGTKVVIIDDTDSPKVIQEPFELSYFYFLEPIPSTHQKMTKLNLVIKQNGVIKLVMHESYGSLADPPYGWDRLPEEKSLELYDQERDENVDYTMSGYGKKLVEPLFQLLV